MTNRFARAAREACPRVYPPQGHVRTRMTAKPYPPPIYNILVIKILHDSTNVFSNTVK
jgi:hypothetical protein